MKEKNSGESAAADADLVLRTRSGDVDAFGELWRRHYRSGMTVARSITSSIDADDLVQEAYSRIYQAILTGGGPNGSFRAYLFTSIRNTAAAWGRRRRETTIDELETVVDPASTDAAASEELDRGLTAKAFRSLPSRWQEVLWYSEIEQMKPAAIGTLLGMSAGAVSQLSFRAREGLREAWIQAHLHSVGEGSECQWTIERLGAYARGNLTTRAHQRVDDHLEGCARCMIVAAEAKDVSSRLTLVLLPLVLGVTGASAYLASLQLGEAPVAALAAMPSSVVEGVVVASATGSAGVAAATGTTGASSSAAAGGSAGSSAGVVSGIGALVGAGSAALVIAGVVAAAAVLPGVLGGAPATSQPNASESDSSSVASADVAPAPGLSTGDPLVIDLPEQPTPAPEPKTDPDADVQAPPAPAPVTVADEPAPPAPEPTAEPTPAETTEPSIEPGTTDPGTTDPGTTDPGTTDPGTTDPGTTDPGTTDPGTMAPITASTFTVSIDASLTTHYSVPIQGEPGATVRAWMDDAPGGGDEIALDGTGGGVIDLRPSLTQMLIGADLTLTYLVDGVPGSSTRYWIVPTLLGGSGGSTPGSAAPATDTTTPTDTTPADATATTDATTPTDAASTTETAPTSTTTEASAPTGDPSASPTTTATTTEPISAPAPAETVDPTTTTAPADTTVTSDTTAPTDPAPITASTEPVAATSPAA